MKKVILGLSGILVSAFVIIMVANAQNNPQEVKKAATETSADCAKCPSSASCGAMTAAKTSEVKTAEVKTCDPAKCKEMGCDPAKCKEGKCDPATCKANITAATGGMKPCDPAKCSGMAKK
jgi:hypothetical protein